MIFSRAAYCAVFFLFVVAACTSSRKVKEAAQPQDEPAASETMPEPAAPADLESEEFSDEADMDESAAEDSAPSDSSVGAGEESGGKGGIISSGVKTKKKPCMSIANPRQRQRCLDRLKQKP
jgi:hypothetical protein